MASPARFMFDNDFAAPPPPPEPEAPKVPMIEVSVHEALMADAVRRAHERGVVEGRNDAEVKAAGRLADEAARLASAAQSILAILDTERLRIEKDALQLAEVIGRQLARELVDMHPRDAIMSVITEALAPLRQTPHLVVRLSADDAEPIGAELKKLAHERGFEGRLVILGEDSIERGDCRIDWADGGIVLNRADCEEAVSRAIDLHIVGMEEEARLAAGKAASGTSAEAAGEAAGNEPDSKAISREERAARRRMNRSETA
ncbi:flagellar assembly protein H [Hartmannibacter diazotrophicus]|uniref:Flagellar assembly protein FliH n=1 Tax=Hartmannibacter diazotrophicus TaxID=1482074 RepID=A0A2C9DBS3_9HYPH|nr:FliH/SctL family protein [Hartmannibacter diazotrophicus]SON57716.1 flagellar assembly protein H [Hartmannibacter diazotrophicus]